MKKSDQFFYLLGIGVVFGYVWDTVRRRRRIVVTTTYRRHGVAVAKNCSSMGVTNVGMYDKAIKTWAKATGEDFKGGAEAILTRLFSTWFPECPWPPTHPDMIKIWNSAIYAAEGREGGVDELGTALQPFLGGAQ